MTFGDCAICGATADSISASIGTQPTPKCPNHRSSRRAPIIGDVLQVKTKPGWVSAHPIPDGEHLANAKRLMRIQPHNYRVVDAGGEVVCFG